MSNEQIEKKIKEMNENLDKKLEAMRSLKKGQIFITSDGKKYIFSHQDTKTIYFIENNAIYKMSNLYFGASTNEFDSKFKENIVKPAELKAGDIIGFSPIYSDDAGKQRLFHETFLFLGKNKNDYEMLNLSTKIWRTFSGKELVNIKLIDIDEMKKNFKSR